MLAATAAVTAAFALAACGDSNDAEADTLEARATVKRFYAALKSGDANGACATLAADSREQIVESLGAGQPGDTCADAFDRFIRNARSTGSLSSRVSVDIQSLKVRGDEALAKVAVGESPVAELPLVYSNGSWRIAAAAAG